MQYFRLAGRQFDGEIVYSHIIKYAENQVNTKIILYPNPITDNSVIQYFSPTETTAMVSLFSLQGETLHTRSHKMVKGINYLPLELSQGMKKGIYLAKLETDQGVFQIKVIY